MAAPLTKEHLPSINEALKVSKDVKSIIARAKTAGLDVDDLETDLLQSEKKLQGIKQAFFPNGRA